MKNIIAFQIFEDDLLPNKKVSVIILNAFNTKNLEECLTSLSLTQYPRFETVVVDCLTPDIKDILGKGYPKVRLISLTEDIGPAAMHNVGISNSNPESEYVAFLDNDTVVDTRWLEELVGCLEQEDSIGAAQSKILLYEKPNELNSCGNLANFLAVGWPEGYGRPDQKTDLENKSISFASGAAMIARKSALEKIGFYDEDFFIYADDLDVGLRLRIAGYEIKYCPTSIVYHKYEFLRSKRSYYYLNRNRIMTFLKLYREKKTYLRMLPAAIIYEVFALGYALKRRYVKELLRAYFDVNKHSNGIRQKRAIINHYRVINDQELISILAGSIRFSEIEEILSVRRFLNPFLDKYRQLLMEIGGRIT